jgi:hypothetical protein
MSLMFTERSNGPRLLTSKENLSGLCHYNGRIVLPLVLGLSEFQLFKSREVTSEASMRSLSHPGLAVLNYSSLII